jgi:hypothetical protein
LNSGEEATGFARGSSHMKPKSLSFRDQVLEKMAKDICGFLLEDMKKRLGLDYFSIYFMLKWVI